MSKILKLTIVAFSLLALIGCSQEEKGEFYLPKTVTIYISDMDGSEYREFRRFEYEYENGYPIKCTLYENGGDPIDFHFELNKENGLLMEAVKMMHYKGDEQATPDRRIVFEYSDIKTDEARYTRMVNAHLIDGDNNYYIFNWY